MKIFLLLLVGALTGIVIAAAAIFYFLVPDGSPPTVTQLENMAEISGTILVPPALAAEIKNGTGFLEVAAFGIDPTTDLPFNSEGSQLRIYPNPTFPLKFSLRQQLKYFGDEVAQNLTVIAYYNRLPVPSSSNPMDSKQQIILGSQRVNIPKKEDGKGLPSQIDAGNVYFFRVYHERPAPNCVASPTLIAGKITPLPRFEKRLEKNQGRFLSLGRK